MLIWLNFTYFEFFYEHCFFFLYIFYENFGVLLNLGSPYIRANTAIIIPPSWNYESVKLLAGSPPSCVGGNRRFCDKIHPPFLLHRVQLLQALPLWVDHRHHIHAASLRPRKDPGDDELFQYARVTQDPVARWDSGTDVRPPWWDVEDPQWTAATLL